ncbi:MAG: DUF6084 family protein [Gemmatimonadota bacterium]|nr:DUF6084 family protein [Gemmatimonadota bacterium]
MIQTDLAFTCLGVRAEEYAAAPTLMLQLQIDEMSGDDIHAIMLRCQIRLEAHRRRYSGAESERLLELFGEPNRWGDTLKPLHFTIVSLMVPSFRWSVVVDVPVPCTYDFDVIAAKYLHALEEGEIPLLLMFSGTVFRKGESGFTVEQVPWHKEAACKVPVSEWRKMMDHYFPNSGWIRIRRDTLDALQRYKVGRAMTNWDQALDALLADREPAP